MIRSIRNKKLGAFTLVELLIVILLIGILMAFALPRFLGNRDSAGDRVAQQTLLAAMGTANGPFSENESYSDADADALKELEPDVNFVDGSTSDSATNSSREVAVTASDDNLVLSARGADVTCWHVTLDARLGTVYSKSETTDGTCDNSAADNSPGGPTSFGDVE